MAIAPARSVAFDVLLRVQSESAYAAEILHAAGSAFQRLSDLDRSLCTQLVMGVLRWQGRLDDAIAGHSRTARLDDEVRIALRLSAFQLGFMDRIPASAAVNDSVELVKRARKRSATSLVNAVLRKLANDPGKLRPCGGPYRSAAEIATDLAHPEWLVKSWADAFGVETAEVICRHNQSLPPVALRLFHPEAEDELTAAGVVLTGGKLMRAARLVVSGDVVHTRPFAEGRIVLQDEASQLVAALLGHGERILDCCAAPGVKTRSIAAENPDAQLIAAELHPHRARMMKTLGIPANVLLLAADARRFPFSTNFDCVLADVPCSGTGTLARNPEIKWKLVPADLDDLRRRQIGILDAALDRLAPRGRLVYSTCSLEMVEGEDVVRSVLASRSGYDLVPVRTILDEIRSALAWLHPEDLARGDFLRTLPGVHPCDGFFAAVITRR
jgi:16S rRNA (cytosine967-C5)-methyltransferase